MPGKFDRIYFPHLEVLTWKDFQALTYGEVKVLQVTCYLLRKAKRHQHTLYPRIQPSIATLSKLSGLCWDYTRDCVWQLHKQGILIVTPRRGPFGRFLTHIYQMGDLLKQRLATLLAKAKARLSPSIWSPPQNRVRTSDIKDLRGFFQQIKTILTAPEGSRLGEER